MFEKTEGTVQNLAGRVQEAYGSATGNTTAAMEGKVRQAAGAVQYGYGEVLNQVRTAAVASPIGTMAIVAGVSFLLGAIWSKR